MKLGPVTKETKEREKNWRWRYSENCDVIAIFLNYGHFGETQKPDSGCIVCKTYIIIKSNLLSYKN